MKRILVILYLAVALASAAFGQAPQPAAANEQLAWDPARTWVFFVGLLEWKDSKSFSSFPQTNRRDAILLDVLRKKGVPESQIVYLKDKDATTAKVKDTFPKFLQKARSGDTVIVYFCGHGYKSSNNLVTYLATYDVSDTTLGWRTDTIPADIESNFRGSNAIILADNCYSGALAEDVRRLKTRRVSYAVMASAHFNSFSTGNWTFTESLIYGFGGEPFFDDNGDGKVTLAEMRTNAERDMLFGEEQVASFEFDGNFGPQSVFSLSTHGKASKRVGEHVEAYSVDGWYRGFIRDEKGGKYRIHYYGYEDTEDEWVASDKIRQVKPTQYAVGSRVDVNWLGKWYRGKVLDVKGSSHYIAFDGFGSEWNEWTPSKRLKPSQSDAKSSPLLFSTGSLVEALDSYGSWYRSK